LLDTPAPPRAGEGWSKLIETMRLLALRKSGWPAELGLVRYWYEPVMRDKYEDAEIRIADILQLEQIGAGYPARENFLTELTLDPPDATSDQSGVPSLDEDYLILSTIHSAKGQEWCSVHVLNVVDGCIPSDLGTGSTHELEEERRLLYVAITRAKDSLHLIVPQRFYPHQQTRHGDRHVYAQRTRFITRAMLEHFEDIFWPPPKAVVIEGLSPAVPATDIAAKMRGMWAK
jgi:DNA helicase-2/ATP-dependent DNA helicase PcrA